VTPEQLSSTIVDVLQALVDDGAVSLPDGVPTTVVVERPRSKEHGDYATNVALQLGKKAGTNPRALAELVAERLRTRMDEAFSAVWARADTLSVSLRRGAFVLALERVAEAISARGLFP